MDLVPPPHLRPDVLPRGRIGAHGMPVRPWRDDLRRIPDGRNGLTVAGALLQTFGVVGTAALVGTWWAYLLAFVWMGRGHALLNILGHEAAHRLLFSDRRVNDAVGRWLLAYPSLQPFAVYRRSHLVHHRAELGPDEPDARLYAGYPIPRASWRRKLTRDACGISAAKNLRSLARAARRRDRDALGIVLVQVLLLATAVAAGAPWAYVVWIGSWATLWKVSNRLRAVAEHGGMRPDEDRRVTTHVVRQSWLARLTIVPYHTGWHLAHHADMGVPWTRLPALHAELLATGWVPRELERTSYRSLWKAAVRD